MFLMFLGKVAEDGICWMKDFPLALPVRFIKV